MAEVRAPNLLRAGAPADLLAEVTDIMAEVRAPGYCSAAIALGATDLSAQLAEIRVPTLVIHGDQDSVVPLSTGRMLAERIPGARLEVIKDAGHASNQEQPEAFNTAVREFLGS